MRAVFGLLLVMLGLAMAIVWMPDSNSERQLAVVTEIATSGLGRRQSAETDRTGRTFSPITPLIATVEPPSTGSPLPGAARIFSSTIATAHAEQTEQSSGVASVVNPSLPLATGSTSGQLRADATPVGRLPPLTDAARVELVRSLQRELKRVGCYFGDIDGDWGSGSRRAIASFTDRVNASLPTDQPDFILLTLVQGHHGTVCGKGCPSGQSAGSNGRCTPTGVVAQAVSGDRRGSSTLSQDIVQSTTSQIATATPASTNGWTTEVGRAPAGSLGVREAVAVGAAVAVAAANTTIAPPGRMTVNDPQTPSSYAGSRGDSLARPVVRAYPQRIEDAQPARPAAQASERRERPRRTRSETRYYAPPAAIYRSARYAPVTSAPRRGRGWTASFFGFP